MTTTHDNIWRRATCTTMTYISIQWSHVTTNDNGWRWWWLQSAARSYYCKPRFTNLLFCQLTVFKLNDMQSTVISITCHSACHTAWRPNVWRPKRPQINTRLTPFIGPEAWQSMMQLLPIATSADPHIRLLPLSWSQVSISVQIDNQPPIYS